MPATIDHRTINFPEFQDVPVRVTENVDPDVYHHILPGISKGDLDAVSRSFAHFRHRRENPPAATPAMEFGSLFHTVLLEPRLFDARYYVTPDIIDRRTKDGKAAWASWVTIAGNRKMIDPEEHGRALLMADSIRAHPVAGPLLTAGIAEKTIQWDEQGMVCKCRPDWISDRGIVADVKTTVDASPKEFTRAVVNFKYYAQASFYLRGLERAGAGGMDWVFVAVEKEPPYAVGVYSLDRAFLDAGKYWWEDGLKKLWWCYEQLDAGRFIEGYATDVVQLTCPTWI